ncbi:DsrE family protein [Aestuariibaculum sp. M13]|uniref:DsrE family protein n=1 Tax=Aestuariibaculum sp. M13 TaxID=2967132 RepID=UPI002159CECA|nr:DsrE family protein [Aestuariibaculum sp. M13]MCR8667826.1 DsrE family protein [Aestuariibaculum sp. M13]
MKTPIKHITMWCFVLFSAITLQAQNENTETLNYSILSKNIQQLKPALITANALAKEDGKTYGNLYVVFCGKTVQDIADNSEFNALLKDIISNQVKIFICGLSLKKFNVNPVDLRKNIQVVENGILYAFQLKKQGFISLTI